MKKHVGMILSILLCLSLLLTGCAVGDAPAGDDSVAAAPTPQATDTPAATDAPVVVAAVTNAAAAVSTITLDINPSIELSVEMGLVTGALAYNDDGEAIVLEADVVGMTPSDAIDAIVDALVAEGYITAEEEAAVVITVSGDGDEAGGRAERTRTGSYPRDGHDMRCRIRDGVCRGRGSRTGAGALCRQISHHQSRCRAGRHHD